MNINSTTSYKVPLRCQFKKGDWIDNFQVEAQLGEGTFGLVYKIKASGNNKFQALKLLKLWEIPYAEEREKVIKRFNREFECGQIEGRHLVKSTAKGTYKGNPYFVMDYCPNGSLAKYINHLPTMPEINQTAIEILLGLKKLHQQGIYHRDIKPENVLFDKNNQVKLADFGIAGFKQQRMTIKNIFGRTQNIFGTYAYIAPEQANNRTAYHSMSAVTDIFSFGVMMFEVFSQGKYPYGKLATNADLANYIQRANKGNWTDIRTYNPTIPAYWVKIIEGCLHPDYKKTRFQQVAQMLELLGYNQLTTLNEQATAIDRPLKLQVMHGEENGKIYELSKLLKQPTGILTIGWKDENRLQKNHIELQEKSTAFISSYHATLEKINSPERWFIKDGQWRKKEEQWNWYLSTNGVMVNSKRIEKKGDLLNLGDIIIIGDTTLKVI